MKVTMLVAGLLLAASTSFGQAFQRGEFSGNVNSEGWNLNAGTGMRTHLVFVKFTKPFAKEPQVVVSMTQFDAAPGKDGNVRMSVKPEQVTRDGFTVKIATWGDSRVAGMEGNWFAYTNK